MHGSESHPDGQIQLVLNKSEMGQGVFTSLPMILAEEAEIDFSRITVVQADNADGTGGSGSVWEGYTPLRQAGAQVREVMIAAAARDGTSQPRMPRPQQPGHPRTFRPYSRLC